MTKTTRETLGLEESSKIDGYRSYAAEDKDKQPYYSKAVRFLEARGFVLQSRVRNNEVVHGGHELQKDDAYLRDDGWPKKEGDRRELSVSFISVRCV